MSFINIKDPKKRVQIVADYVATIRRIQERNEDEKSTGLAKQAELEHTFQPIIQATEKSTEAITKQLATLQHLTPKPKKQTTWDENSKETAIEYYLKQDDIDKYFGIQQQDDKLVMGNKNVQVYTNSDLSVDNHGYKGTPGLWRLIMTKNPTGYTNEDLDMYKHLINRTNVIGNPHVGSGRPTTTKKWKFLETMTKKGQGIFLQGDIKGLTNKLNLLL